MSSFVQYINWFFQSFSEAHALDSGYKQKGPLLFGCKSAKESFVILEFE